MQSEFGFWDWIQALATGAALMGGAVVWVSYTVVHDYKDGNQSECTLGLLRV